jgi:hypothetical protein
MEQGRRRRLLYLRNRSSHHHSSHRSPAALQGQGHRDDPPQSLASYPPLAEYANGLLWISNHLQLFMPVGMLEKLWGVGGVLGGMGGRCRGMRTFVGGEVAERVRGRRRPVMGRFSRVFIGSRMGMRTREDG